ncbi:MAG: DUF3343 domain-containing protein [Deltaproteobacteria bacterium]|jgi:hypothetical protein|nr:DUF3343 domain-containing protein [Deltaproteobacteria bacterium]
MKTIITFKSTTHALDSEQLLLKAGLSVGLMSRPTELGSDCGFCLTVTKDDLDKALGLIKAAGLVWQGTYLHRPESKPRWQKMETCLEP